MRISLFPAKLALFRAAIALVSAAATFGAAESTPPVVPKVAVPIVSSDKAVQKELMELDRLLNTNPQLEETLRNNIDQLTEETFRRSNPDIDVLLKQKPGIVPALKLERHFLIHRYIVRIAHGPVLRRDILALDKFLTAHPDIRKALNKEPSQIVRDDFLIAHPSLGEFFTEHPSISTVLLENQAAQSGPKNK